MRCTIMFLLWAGESQRISNSPPIRSRSARIKTRTEKFSALVLIRGDLLWIGGQNLGGGSVGPHIINFSPRVWLIEFNKKIVRKSWFSHVRFSAFSRWYLSHFSVANKKFKHPLYQKWIHEWHQNWI
jgi:hypothetical protein